MTVWELIEKLKNLEQDKLVITIRRRKLETIDFIEQMLDTDLNSLWDILLQNRYQWNIENLKWCYILS